MHKILKMTGLLLFLTVSFTVIGLISFFSFAPQIGARAEGARLNKMMLAENFRNGKFFNTVSTKMDVKSGKMLGVMWEFLTGGKDREPDQTIQVRDFKKDEFMNSSPQGISFTWFGHSSLLIRIDQKILLIDPVFSERASMFSFMGPKRFRYSQHMTVDMLPPLDAVLISHDHYDHLDYKTILKLADKAPVFFVPLSVGAHLEKWGVPPENIEELSWWESARFDNLNLAFAPSRHFSGRGLNNRFSTLWGSWVIQGSKHAIYYGGDSGYFPGFKEIGEKYGPFDITFLECGAYNENWSQIHMMPEESVQAHIDLKGKYFMPIHWGKFNLSLHPWKEPVERASLKASQMGVNILTPEIGKVVILNNQVSTSEWWKDYH